MSNNDAELIPSPESASRNFVTIVFALLKEFLHHMPLKLDLNFIRKWNDASASF